MDDKEKLTHHLTCLIDVLLKERKKSFDLQDHLNGERYEDFLSYEKGYSFGLKLCINSMIDVLSDHGIDIKDKKI